jgi:hypothetical protein
MIINYDEIIILDAEELAEGGIKQAYDELLPELQKFILLPANIEETLDVDAPRYSVRCDGIEYVIFSPEIIPNDSWDRATVVFFEIINRQIGTSNYRLYALNGGNDLGGIFLTDQQAQEAQKSLPDKMDWPYIPELTPPWYGCYHD